MLAFKFFLTCVNSHVIAKIVEFFEIIFLGIILERNTLRVRAFINIIYSVGPRIFECQDAIGDGSFGILRVGEKMV